MFSTDQLLELFVVLCVIDQYRYAFSRVKSALTYSQAKSGPVRPDSIPSLFVVISPLQTITCFLVPTTYMLSIVAFGFCQPQWMKALALPDVWYGVQLEEHRKNTLRVAACVANIYTQTLTDSILEHLDDQFHSIGRREKPRVVQTGPYAWVRHPFYALSLFNEVLWCLAFWSYAPLFSIVAAVVVYAVKIPVEEEAIQRDDAIREEYRAYMRKVPARLIPYVW